MKKQIIKFVGFSLLGICALAYGEELCTEDFLFNASFSDVDNLGIPFDWYTRTVDDAMGFEVENDVLKIWVNEGGNFDDCSSGESSSQDLVLGQKPVNENTIFRNLAGDTVYLRAWVKTTAVDEPTMEELKANFLECRDYGEDVFDTATIEDEKRKTKFYNNEASNSGFQLVVQQAFHYSPNFTPKEWTPWYDHDGAAVEEWTPVMGKVVLRDDVNRFRFWILLQSKSACTVWVDNIQVSSSPEFCGESFESPDGTVETQSTQKYGNHRTIRYHSNTIYFNRHLGYSLQVYTLRGQQCMLRSGYAEVLHLKSLQLPAGAYIINVKTEKGDVLQQNILQR